MSRSASLPFCGALRTPYPIRPGADSPNHIVLGAQSALPPVHTLTIYLYLFSLYIVHMCLRLYAPSSIWLFVQPLLMLSPLTGESIIPGYSPATLSLIYISLPAVTPGRPSPISTLPNITSLPTDTLRLSCSVKHFHFSLIFPVQQRTASESPLCPKNDSNPVDNPPTLTPPIIPPCFF